MTQPARAYRLPKHVRPRAYEIELHTDPSREDFHGTVEIHLEISAPAATIDLHARGLQIGAATVAQAGPPQPVASVRTTPEQQTVTLTLAAPLERGLATARLEFSGKLCSSMHGLYLGTDGTHRAICSQCEATDARAIFPCFDEPEFKASLKWTLHTGPDVIALTNGPLASRHDVATAGTAGPQTGQVFRFAETFPVASYLAAVVVGDFESCPEQRVHDIPLRVYAPRGKAGQTSFAQDFTARLLPFYEHYFDYRYPFAKYDQVAVPGFDAGAMENIGLVLFRQNLLLMDGKTASWRQEKLIAKVIAHEFAHMWFGNLVTMKWWDDLWLNEAFAEWMAHKACHAVEPSYEVWNDFAEDKSRALFDDALLSTHPIYTEVQTPDEAIEMFDSITYQKGCAVMRMLENFLGDAPFMAGLRAYMKAFAAQNAEGADLWRALEAASGQPVGQLMRSWITQPGFPLLDVAQLGGTDDAAGARVRIRQQRFFSDENAAPSTQLWSVPVVLRFEDSEGKKTHRFICATPEHIEALPAVGAVRWCYANTDEIGFYRTNPDENTLTALLRYGLGHLSPVEQAGLLEDQWALVRCGRNGIEPFLDVLRALGPLAAQEHNVLRALIERLDTLDLIVKDSGDRAARERLRAMIRQMLSPHLLALGYEPRPGEAQNDTQRRALLIGALASLGRDPQVIATAEQHAAREQSDPAAVDPNLAGILVAIAAKFGDETRFDSWVRTFLARKSEGRTPQEVARYLHTLSSFRAPGLPERTLDLIEQGVIPQEAISSILAQLLDRRHAQEAAWSYFKTRWGVLRERVGDMGLSRVVEAVGRLRAVHREDVVSFFQQHTPAGAERALLRALERMDQSEALRRRITAGLLRALSA